MPKWNPVFGHLLVVNDAFKKYKLPVDIQRPDIFSVISEEFEESDSLFYMNLWALINPLLLTSPLNYAIQTFQQNNLDKPADLVPFLHPIAGGDSIFSANGTE